ncbi:Uncharacterised protein [Corynebacterium kutscheri]|uniref:Uncharacterized protein n=1 Tax=Corynebacterium kutscheri TaxID=35755 RepID=A0A0F6QZT8_9CORY|nr:hypothetical protein UL82_03430 [Corynebacterium kutscheri]VEH06673.1 Uncharacterised protein [Corynebacterium kutscheri]VEH09192.1 Uncharacterised protein [Corynebacterium kutscheri]VEH79277.1 Uncharacterised protein [Corynebacterium kutscheri]
MRWVYLVGVVVFVFLALVSAFSGRSILWTVMYLGCALGCALWLRVLK